MLERFGPKRRLVIDLIFAAVLALLFWAMRSGLRTLQQEVVLLFAASYILLGLGALVFFLLAGMNFRVASLVHVGTFPFLGVFYLFGKWMPVVIGKVGSGEEGALSLCLLAYVLILVAFLVSQLLLHLTEPEPERVRQFRRLAL